MKKVVVDSKLQEDIIKYLGKYIIILLILFVYNLAHLYGSCYLIVMNVGQGDSSLLVYEKNVTLIDGGSGDFMPDRIANYLGDRNVIDYLIITHNHLDHYEGIYGLLNHYKFNTVILSDDCVQDISFGAFLYQLKLVSRNIVYADIVKISLLNDTFSIEFDNYLPDICSSNSNTDVNNSSIITIIESAKFNILLMGDAEKEREKDFIKYYSKSLPKIDYMKAGHHCSDTSSSLEFITFIRPTYVICSYGVDNSYGHPSPSVINMFGSLHIPVIHTKDGDTYINLTK